ncbi:MAG: hypothetical protein JW839_09130 [Candidatus Lokiarchaeota archaeon]|nr:hypothetical protein [Candidatus Lokiarchaeota archaeon]
MEPFYAWYARNRAAKLACGAPWICGRVNDTPRRQAREGPARRFRQLTLVESLCAALLS